MFVRNVLFLCGIINSVSHDDYNPKENTLLFILACWINVKTVADQTIEYGSEGKLYCEVSAYPEAEIEWYHNDTEVKQSEGVQIESENNALWIKNMTVSDIGEYKCKMSNEANMKSFIAFVNISGIGEVLDNNIILRQ